MRDCASVATHAGQQGAEIIALGSMRGLGTCVCRLEFHDEREARDINQFKMMSPVLSSC